MTQTPAPTDGGPARAKLHPPGAPNYAARRMLVSTIAITLVIAVGVAAWRLGRDEEPRHTGAGGEWDEVALVDRATGAIVTVDPAGEIGTTLPGSGRVTGVHVDGDRIATVGSGQIVLTGLDSAAPVTVPIELGATVTRLPIADALWLAVGKASGGNVILVDGRTGTSIDVGALAGQTEPRFYTETIRHDAAGTVFAIADAANFQTIVVRPGAVAPAFLPDQPIAVNGGHVATSQVVGQQADVTLFDAERRALATVPIGLPAGGVFDGDSDEVVVVAIDGGVYRFGDGDEQAERIGTVAVPAGATIRFVRPVAGGSRLVVFGDVFEAVIDLDGETVFTTTFAVPVDPPAIEPGWSCLPVGGGDSYHSLIALDSGAQLADLTGLAVDGTAADGCTVIGVRNGLGEVVGSDGSVALGNIRSATLAPDGRAVVRERTGGAVELVAIGDDWRLSDPVELSTDAPANSIVAYIRR